MRPMQRRRDLEGRPRTVAFYKFNALRRAQQRLLDESLSDQLRRALDPDVIVDWWSREWRLGRPTWQDGVALGKFGYVQPAKRPRNLYDEEVHDFVSVEDPNDQVGFVHFVVDSDHRILAFEVKPPRMTAPNIANAFQQLLRQTDVQFRIDAVLNEPTFEAWRAKVDRVTSIRVRANRPNPRSARPKTLLRRLASTGADQIELAATTSSERGLNLDDDLLSHAVGHITSGYGSLTAMGVHGTRVIRFSSKRAAVTVVVHVGVEDDDEIYRLIQDETQSLET